MTKIGIGISCYDKFDELELLIDMIRSWGDDYEIGLCCNHPDGVKYRHLVDYYIQGRDLPFIEGDTREKTFFWNQDVNYMIRVRAADSVRSVCWLMTERSNCDWIIHVHADAWFMHKEGVEKFISDCIDKGCFAACRGTGMDTVWKPMGSTSAYGQADDHFFAFHKDFAYIHDCWSYYPEDLLMRKYSVHGLLMTIFAVKFGLRNVWYYKELKDCLDCYEEPLRDDETKPCVFDPDYGFLHLHRGSLPEGWGVELQAYFMMKYAQKLPQSWMWFIKNAGQYQAVQSKIKQKNTQLNKKLKLMLYPPNILRKTRITYKQALVDRFTLFTLVRNIKKRVLKWLDGKVFPKQDTLAYYTKLNKNIKNDWTKVWDKHE